MNKIGIIFAMKEELDELLNIVDLIEEINIYDLTMVPLVGLEPTRYY